MYDDVSEDALITQRDHRKRLLRRSGAACRKIVNKTYQFIAPRVAYPKLPARPTLYIAEGAETVHHQRLICPGQLIEVRSKRYCVCAIFWAGSKIQGKTRNGSPRYSPRSKMQALLIPTPLPEPLTVGQFDTNFYVRAYLEDLFHSDNPDPVVDPIISTLSLIHI